MRMTIQERKDRAAEALFIDVMCPIKKATSYLQHIEQSERAADLIRKDYGDPKWNQEPNVTYLVWKR